MTTKAELELTALRNEELVQPLNEQHANIISAVSERCEKARRCVEERKEVVLVSQQNSIIAYFDWPLPRK